MKFKSMNIFVLFFISVALVACSSSSSTDITTNTGVRPSSAADVNVAAASNGSTVSSTFSGNETFTTDSDMTTSSSWSGGMSGDEVKVTFDQTYSISSIKLTTNNTSTSISGGVATSGFRIYVSNDDVTYSEVAIYFGSSAPVACFSMSIGSGRIECVLNQKQDVRYVRVAVTSDFATTELYEIEVMGS